MNMRLDACMSVHTLLFYGELDRYRSLMHTGDDRWCWTPYQVSFHVGSVWQYTNCGMTWSTEDQGDREEN